MTKTTQSRMKLAKYVTEDLLLDFKLHLTLLNEIICATGKGMNPIILPPAMGK